MDNKNELTPKEKREKVMKLILNKQYGETVTFEEINKILQEDLKEYNGIMRFRNNLSKIKNRLFEQGIVIRNVYNVGVYILKPSQVSSYTYRNYINKPIKKLDKAKTILDNTNKKMLNKNELSEHILTSKLNAELKYATTEIINQQEYKILDK